MKVTLVAVVSLDGCLTRHDDADMAALSSAEDVTQFRSFLSSCDAQVCGSATYLPSRGRELALISSGKSQRQRVVLTRDPSKFDDDVREADRGPIHGLLRFSNDSPRDVVAGLRAEGFQHVALLGGGETYNAFLEANLIDAMRITIETRVFGTGVRLAGTTNPIDPQFQLQHVEQLGPNTLLLLLTRVLTGS
jgi:riboflavin biosynthesis pyrimidine reductase